MSVKLAPNPSPVALPGNASSVMDTVIGWGLTLAGILAVLCLVGAGISFMFSKGGHSSNNTTAWLGGIGGGLLLATSAGAIINAF